MNDEQDFEIIDIYKTKSSCFVIAKDKHEGIFNLGPLNTNLRFEGEFVKVGQKITCRYIEELTQFLHEETQEIRYRKKIN